MKQFMPKFVLKESSHRQNAPCARKIFRPKDATYLQMGMHGRLRRDPVRWDDISTYIQLEVCSRHRN